MAAKLKLSTLEDERPVRLTVELPAAVHKDLVTYGEIIGRESGGAVAPSRLVVPMLTRFMATDRGFARAKAEGRRR
jgi:hypothetical protein